MDISKADDNSVKISRVTDEVIPFDELQKRKDSLQGHIDLITKQYNENIATLTGQIAELDSIINQAKVLGIKSIQSVQKNDE